MLVRYGLCPPLTEEQLEAWREKKRYPLDAAFLRWQRTDDNAERNPYHDRYRALTETLDLSDERHRHALGRALYHLAQRRGFLSNRKEAGNGKEEGAVQSGIENLSAEMEKAGCRYLGEYFYQLYRRKEKIRKRYTSRNKHYLAEFNAICERQCLPEEWRKALHRAIFSSDRSNRRKDRWANAPSSVRKAAVRSRIRDSRSFGCARSSTTSG